jgi:hypothetical protein
MEKAGESRPFFYFLAILPLKAFSVPIEPASTPDHVRGRLSLENALMLPFVHLSFRVKSASSNWT